MSSSAALVVSHLLGLSFKLLALDCVSPCSRSACSLTPCFRWLIGLVVSPASSLHLPRFCRRQPHVATRGSRQRTCVNPTCPIVSCLSESSPRLLYSVCVQACMIGVKFPDHVRRLFSCMHAEGGVSSLYALTVDFLVIVASPGE